MRSRAFATIAFSLSLAAIVNSRADMGADDEQRLIQAAYFSAACRGEAEALGVVGATDANALVAAFIAVAGRLGFTRQSDAPRDDCGEPVVLLINLLRLNGRNAELAFAFDEPTNKADVDAPSGKPNRLLVYVPTLDRYFDPMAPLSEQAVLDRSTVEKGKRVHILGPSLNGGERDACPSVCMRVYSPVSHDSVRVRIEIIPTR